MDRCASVLHRYPIILFTPEKFARGGLSKRYPNLGREIFPDEYFLNAYTYDKLMLSDEFRARLAASPKMREVLAALPRRAELYRSATPSPSADRPTGRWSEDVFFSVEANRYRRRVKIPGVKIAAQFSWETNPAIAASL